MTLIKDELWQFVQLLDGPIMLVKAINEDNITCCWFSGKNYQETIFPKNLLHVPTHVPQSMLRSKSEFERCEARTLAI